MKMPISSVPEIEHLELGRRKKGMTIGPYKFACGDLNLMQFS